MPNAYSKEDVDRAYAAGVANAEKLWQSFVLSMLDEGSVRVQCFECQKCQERYRIDPDVDYPEVILCPSCIKHRCDGVGVCHKVDRRALMTQYELTAMEAAMEKIIDPLVILRQMFQTSPAAQGLTIQQVQQLPQYQALMRALAEVQAMQSYGWDMPTFVEILLADGGVPRLTPLGRYDPLKPVTCA